MDFATLPTVDASRTSKFPRNPIGSHQRVNAAAGGANLNLDKVAGQRQRRGNPPSQENLILSPSPAGVRRCRFAGNIQLFNLTGSLLSTSSSPRIESDSVQQLSSRAGQGKLCDSKFTYRTQSDQLGYTTLRN